MREVSECCGRDDLVGILQGRTALESQGLVHICDISDRDMDVVEWCDRHV